MILRRLSNWPLDDWTSSLEGFERMRRDLDILMNTFSDRQVRNSLAGVFPLVNLTEDKDNFHVRAELPGIKSQELDISVTGNSLSISGERKIAEESAQAKYHRREREAGKFSRVISLPTQIDTDKVNASSTDGVLTVTLPKAEIARPKQIAVKAS